MRRSAILIGSNSATSSALQGVDADMKRLYQHLTSEFGGAWAREEIRYYKAPTVSELTERLDAIRFANPDFLLVAFSGHGFEDEQGDPYICLQDDEDFAVADLRVGLGRQVTIVDACRVVVAGALVERAIKTATDVGAVEDPSYRASCRALFDARLKAVPNGEVLLQACSSDQTSSDYPSGGLFLQSLVSRARTAASQNSDWRRCSKWRSACACFLAAQEETQRINREQTPISSVWGQGGDLPFVVA